jgi:hypothetical protein
MDVFPQLLYAIGIILLVLAVIIGVAAGALYVFLLLLRHRRRERSALDFALLQVAVPKENEIKIDAAEQMFAGLAGLKAKSKFGLSPGEHVAFEIVARYEDIRFYVSCPRSLRDFFERQIHGAYPGAVIEEVEEYNVFASDAKVAFTGFKLKSEDYYPIKTYKDLAVDPLAILTSAMSKMGEDEAAVLQIVVGQASEGWRKKGKSYVKEAKSAETDPEKPTPLDPKMVEGVEKKTAKPGFSTAIRVVVVAPEMRVAKAHLANIKGAFRQFDDPLLNSLTTTKSRVPQLFMVDFIYRHLPLFGKVSVLSSEELATLFHFPNKSIETPHIYWLYAKRSSAPAGIASEGLYIGKNIYRGTGKEVYIAPRDRRQHVYIVGKTGVGKSTLLVEMILQDIKNGEGIIFIDPHDAIDEVLQRIPPERAEDVILFDPSDTERPMGLNMMEAYTEEQQHFLTTSVIGLMYKLFDPHQTGIIGPRFEHAVRNAMLTVMSRRGNTFVEVVRCLTDPKFVQEMLPYVTDPVVRRYWTDQIAQTADFHKSEVLDYVVSKFGRFVTNKLVRNIIGQSVSAFDFREVMDTRKILLIKLPKGKIGEENSNFLGLILIPKILIAAMSRTDTPEEKRVDCYLYVDEFQNFATPDFAQILSEARKYHLNLTVANQFIGQMDEEVKNAIFGNVGTLMAFRVGVTDANYLQHEFQPTFNESDLINIEKYNIYMKTIVKNEPLPPFSVNLEMDMSKIKRNPQVAEIIKELSRLRYGRPKEDVEREITQRAGL